FPRYFIGELALGLSAVLCASLSARLWPKARLWWLDLLSLSCIGLALIDLRLSQIIGTRLEWDVLTFGDSPVMLGRMAKPYLPSALAGLSVAALLYFVGVRVVERWIQCSRVVPGESGPPIGLVLAVALFTALAALGLANAVPDKAEGQSVLRLARSSP